MSKHLVVVISLFILYSTMGIGYVFFGTLHLDEAAYLHASRAVMTGSIPYRDFFYLQSPIHPYFYGLLQLISPGLVTARLTSFGLGLATLFIMSKIARRLAGKNAEVIFIALFAMNPFQAYFNSITRLYALSGFWIALGLFFFTINPKPNTRHSFYGLFFFSLAVGTRLTLFPMLAIACLYILINSHSITSRILTITGTFLTLTTVFLPFIQLAGIERIVFNLLGMNLSLHSRNTSAVLFQKINASSQFFDFYFLCSVLMIPPVIIWTQNLTSSSLYKHLRSFATTPGLIWALFLSQWIIHLTAKIYQVSYQTPIMPIAILIIAISWATLLNGMAPNLKHLFTIFLVSGTIFSILAYGRSSIGTIDGKPVLSALSQQVRFLQSVTPSGSRIFSADSSLVPLEANMSVLDGMAGSDLFPDWSNTKCQHFHVLNFDIMRDVIEAQEADIVIYGDRSFTLSLPYLEPIPPIIRSDFIAHVERHYERIAVFPNLFIPGTKTYYLKRKTTE